ncbi:MAG TPA: GFA family protein [Hyphomicrobiales bacterium]|nr:GFA family protein [Hyphomicrobiales bacterium]
MADTTHYTGSCHCGAVSFEVDMALDSVVSCNCSHCSRKGFLLAFVPADQFTLLSGQEALSEYRFHRKAIAHKFCKHCGVQAFAYGAMPDGSPCRAINVRCLDEVDIAALAVQQVDGKQF